MLFSSINDVLEYNLELDRTKEDKIYRMNDIEILSPDEMRIDTNRFKLNKFLIQQMFKRMSNVTNHTDFNFGATIVNYLMQFPQLRHNALVQHLQDFNQKYRNINFLGRLNNNNLRAILSDNYSILNNTTVLSHIINNVLPNRQLRILNDSRVTEDNLVLKLLAEDFDENGLGIGIAISNNELGIGSVSFYGLVKRAQCDNSIVNSGNIRYYHRGDIYGRLEDTIPQIVHQLEHAKALRDKFNLLNNYVLEKDKLAYMLTSFAKKNNLSDKIKDQMFIGTEEKTNFQAFINGITYGAKGIDDPTERLQIESIAGNLVNKDVDRVIREYTD